MMNDLEGALGLVVDDDPVSRLLVRRSLEGFGFREVLEAADGSAAQKILDERSDIDLVLTDILMPGIDGLELLRWGREHHPELAWIILSGLDTFDTAVEAIRLGAFDFLAKPPRLEPMEVALRNALEKRRLLEERERLHGELEVANEQLLSKVRELEEKSELLRRDLERAEVIQRALLPAVPPPIDRLNVHSLYRPGQHVGGDLYDVVPIDERHVALFVADATGHGVSAAMLSVLFKQRLVLTDAEDRPLTPAAVLVAVNHAFAESVIAPGLFLTAAYCLLDTADWTVTLASAGHPPVLHQKADGETRLIRRTGPALGLTADAAFGEERLQLERGDRLLLYTDGLLQSGVDPGSEQLRTLLARRGCTADEVLSGLLDSARDSGAGADQDGGDADDVTLLLLDVGVGPSRFDNGSARSGAGVAPRPPSSSDVVFYGETEDATHLALRGRATWTQCDAFYETACAIIGVGRPLVLDLSECEYLDSTFLGTMHELTAHSEVCIEGVKPEVRSLFEELHMDRVLECIGTGGGPAPELRPLIRGGVDPRSGKLRILRAHEALSELSGENRSRFQDVVESMRADQEGG